MECVSLAYIPYRTTKYSNFMKSSDQIKQIMEIKMDSKNFNDVHI